MKKIFTLLVALAGLVQMNAQESHQTTPFPPIVTPQYSGDITIQNAPTIDQRRVRISVAFNGWLYAAYSTYDSTANSGGITIRKSTDNGQTWSTMDSYTVPDIRYTAHDIVVAGTDTNNLVLYLAGVNHNITANTYVMFVDRYNATTGGFNGSNYNLGSGTRPIYDVALASDYRFPAVGASPYSVGLLYSTYSSSYDSIVFLCSTDGGGSWGYRQSVATTGGYNRNVSLAYGRSASASNGRYFGAWEQLGSSSARTGHIFTSRSQSTVDGSWITPINLDSISSTMINLCRNPQLAVQFNGTDNDSGSCTAVVLVERDYNGDGSDYDLLGFYNKRAHYTNYWYRLDIVNSGENDLYPDVSYDPTNNNFLAVYQDSTNGKLPYLVNGFNLATPSTWTTINPQYNDVTTNIKAAWPRVEINPVVTQTAHAWIAEGTGTHGVAMFDAEYVYTGVNNLSHGGLTGGVYPNPASDMINLTCNIEKGRAASVIIVNVVGETVSTLQLEGNSNSELTTSKIDVSTWANGVYFCRIVSEGKTITHRFVVAH